MNSQMVIDNAIKYNPITNKIMIYYNNQWNDWVSAGGGIVANPVIYYYGENNTDVSGGWSALAYYASGASASSQNATTKPSITYNSDHIKISVSGSTLGTVWSGLKVDLTNYSAIKINASFSTGGNGNGRFRITDTKKNAYTTTKSVAVTSGSHVMDISSITGEYYLFFSIYYGTMKVYSIELVL